MSVAIVIPVWNEAEAIGRVLAEVPSGVAEEVIVVDGGSRDGTVEVARAAGARVIVQEARGYGAACIEGARAARSDVLVFLDGDYSDPPAAVPSLLAPLIAATADLVLGVRRGRVREALPRHARMGNRLAALLVVAMYGKRVSDLPSFKAIRKADLLALPIVDSQFGWTTEVIARSLRSGLRVAEVPVDYRPRIGASKVSGTWRGSLRAGLAIVGAIARVRMAPTGVRGSRPPTADLRE